MGPYHVKKEEKKWHLVDLNRRVLGRVATQIADILRGKNRPQFIPYGDEGDFVVAVNASKILLTGRKLSQKTYFRHTGYPGGIREISAGDLLKKKPEEILRKAVRGMLPKNILGRHLLRKLKIYAGNDHPHQAQKPQELKM